MLRKIQNSDVLNKTIKHIENTSVNVVRIIFTDNSVVELWAECAIAVGDSYIPGIFIEDNPSV